MVNASDCGRQPVGEEVTNRHEATDEDRANGKDDHRDGHESVGLVRVNRRPFRFSRPTCLAVEGHEEQTRHVERGDTGTDQGNQAVDPADPRCFDRTEGVSPEGCFNDLVLRPEAGERRNTEDCQPTHHERDPRNLHDGTQSTEATHIHLVSHAVHD